MVARLFILSILVMAPLCAGAADLPKQGTDSYTIDFVAISSSSMKAGDHTVRTYESGGISRNDNGGPMFNNMGVRCIGMFELAGNVATNRGTCIDTDKDGDEIFSTYEAKGMSGLHTFVGGTGKYAGITGTAEYTVEPVKSFDGTPMNIIRHKATWRLP